MAKAKGNGERVCLGAFAGAHGVRGLVRIKAFTEEPEALAAYGPLSDEAGGRQFRLTLKGRAKGLLLAAVEGVGDRDQAEALKGTRLYVPRAALPATEDEDTFYQADLLGLIAETQDGSVLGQVAALQDFGAGPVLEIRPARGESFFLAFTRAAVPTVDIAGGRLVVVVPDEIVAQSGETGETD